MRRRLTVEGSFWRQVPDYVWQHDDLQPTDVVMWCALMSYAPSHGEKVVWPAYTTLAEKAGVSKATVKRSIGRLEEAGAISSTMEPDRSSKTYSLHLDPPSRRGVVTDDHTQVSGVVTDDHSGVVTDDHLTKTHGTKTQEPLSSGDDGEDGELPYTMSHVEAFDVLAEACRLDADGIREVGGGLIGRNAKIIRDLRVSKAEVLARADSYRRKHPDWDLTPAALVKWWPTLQPAAAGVATCECGQPLNSHSDMAHDALMETA